MRIDGACHCGAITFSAEGDPANVRICHCTDCQTLSGSAFRTVLPVNAADFELQTGSPRIYIKMGSSGRKRAQAFCADCGSPIYATTGEGEPDVVGIRLGVVRQRDQLAPHMQYWTDSAVKWLGPLQGIDSVGGNNRPKSA